MTKASKPTTRDVVMKHVEEADAALTSAKLRHIEATRVSADALVDLQRAMMNFCDASEMARRLK